MLTHPLSIDTRLRTNDDLVGVWNLTKMSPSLLNIFNDGSKPEEFSLNDIEVVVDSEGENLFKRAHVGKFLGFAKILISVEGLDTQEMPHRDDIKAMVSNPYP